MRRLRKVVERAVILDRGAALDFDLPFTGQDPASAQPSPRADAPAGSSAPLKFHTEVELECFEGDNLALVLEAANWKTGGDDGAAELLGVKPTTLLSRMNKWGLKKPERGPT